MLLIGPGDYVVSLFVCLVFGEFARRLISSDCQFLNLFAHQMWTETVDLYVDIIAPRQLIRIFL